MSIDKNNEMNSSSSGDVAVIGEGSPNSTPVSLQIVQNIFHELTGKSEEVSKSFNDSFRIELSDLEQLHYRVTQCCEQYNLKAENLTAKVFYVNDTQDTFTSFEKFRAFNAASSSTVESVLFTYNFLILLPKLNAPQSYTITIRLASKAAIENKMRGEIFGLPKIFRIMGSRAGVVSVKYVDYNVARNILNVVDEWMKTVPKSPISKVMQFFQSNSHFVPDFFKLSLLAVSTVLVYRAIPIVLSDPTNFRTFGSFIITAFLGMFIGYQVGNRLGRLAENALDSWTAVSYLKLTAGDKKEIEEAEERNKKTLTVSILSLVGTVIAGVLARVISDWIIGQ